MRLLIIAAALSLALPAVARPTTAPPTKLTTAQHAAMGDVVPSGAIALLAGYGTETCPMPTMFASGYRTPALSIIAKDARRYALADVDAAVEAYRTTLAGCGFPVPEAEGSAVKAESEVFTPRITDGTRAGVKGAPGAAVLVYNAGWGENLHNLPSVFAVKHDGQPMLVVSGKGHAPKAFALPGQWKAGIEAYAALRKARGYPR